MDLSDIRRTKICDNCKIVLPLDKVRLFPKDETRNFVLCEPCCTTMKNRAVAKPKFSQKTAVVPSTDYVNYVCLRCKYNFRADSSKFGVTCNLACPYCGKTDQIHKKEMKKEVKK